MKLSHFKKRQNAKKGRGTGIKHSYNVVRGKSRPNVKVTATAHRVSAKSIMNSEIWERQLRKLRESTVIIGETEDTQATAR